MFKLRASLIATILGTVLVTGCITVKRPLWTTAVNYNRSIERSENKLLLLNIVRSSKRLPRYYSAVTGVTSTVNVGLTPSLSFTDSSGDSLSSVDGSAAGVAANGIVNAVTEGVTDTLTSAIGLPQASTTGVTSIASLQSKEFIAGINRPVDLDQFALFWHQGWNRGMLLLLLVESIEFEQSELSKLLNGSNEDGGKDHDSLCDSPETNTGLTWSRSPASQKKTVLSFIEDACQKDRTIERIKLVNDPGDDPAGLCLGQESHNDAIAFSRVVDFFLNQSNPKYQLQLKAGAKKLSIEGSETFNNQVTVAKELGLTHRLSLKFGTDKQSLQIYEPQLCIGEICLGSHDDDTRIVFRSWESIIHYLGEVVRAQEACLSKPSATGEWHDLSTTSNNGRSRSALFVAGARSDVVRNSARPEVLISVNGPKPFGGTYAIPVSTDRDHLSESVLSFTSTLFGMNRSFEGTVQPGVVVGLGG